MPSREVMQGRPSSSSSSAAAAASPVGSSPTESAELVVVDTGSIAAGAARDADAAAPPSPPSPAATGMGDDAAQVPRHSARRLLVDAATDGAGASCHSNNVHITCAPPSPR
ncbi:hypothetical protein OsI_13278 [Oryza sativa Indica Group]|nr:hypothetical protein LOC_Os03g50610 [Oryza sativa Japonica Group]EAY91642.1 hypothetical protein OsI_13278 [Oryza sativa Indica Group]EAZ28365.1 hypothetical protein OsJ_12342 [Oryza sativa Japonica Group]